MTWKAGDTVGVPVYLESAAGGPQTYSSLAAFQTAGWTATFYQGATALASQPAVTLAPIGTTGTHTLTFLLPAGVDFILILPPTGFRSDPAMLTMIVPSQDTDSLASTIVAAVGGPATATAVTAFDFTIIEGDNFVPQEFTVPLASLRVLDTTSNIIFQYADLTDITAVPWTAVSSARGAWNQLPANTPNFNFSTVFTDKVNRKVAIGFYNAVPAAAVVVNPDGTADTLATQVSTVYKYDIQLQPPAGSTYAGRKFTVVTGNLTIIRQQTTSP